MEPILPYVWAGGLLFARIGSVLMLAPGWGESAIPARFRLSAALLAVMALAPGLLPTLPAQPANLGSALFLIIGEVLIGLMLGGAARMFMAAASVAGQVTAMHTGLAMAMQFDPTQQSQGNVMSTFFSLIAVIIVLAAGVHRWMLEGAVDSYMLFPPGDYPDMADVAEYGVMAFVETFRLGIQIAAPAIAFGLIFNLALGLAARLIPQIQIYFIALPSSLMLGLVVVMIGMGAGFTAWVNGFDQFLTTGGGG
ncbi:MAG: flagellar biosynthetic protein FliR [Ponticaulis sp.]|nr:flagellar biosynthetic protein FliR [Ponticaulis sp.]